MEPKTLVDVLRQHAAGEFAQARRGYYQPSTRQVQWVPVGDIAREAFGFARLLREELPSRRSICLLHNLESRAQTVSILAAMAAGSAPLVLPRNAFERGTRAFVEWVNGIFDSPPLIISETLRDPELPFRVTDGSVARATQEKSDAPPATPGRIAHLQCTSASTGSSKVARITHDNVLCNVRAIATAVGGRSADEVMCSWLPLYHDMGLIACEFMPLVHGYPHVSMRAYDFLRRPSSWLRLISECRGTLSPAPNFAFQYAADHAQDDELEGVSLETWRAAYNGAEPVRVGTLRKFFERFAKFGFRAKTFCPCYGLAEATLAVSIAFDHESRYVVVDRNSVKLNGRLGVRAEGNAFDPAGVPTAGDDELLVISCGPVVSDTSVSLDLGREGETNEENVVGEIVVRGRSVFDGYASREDAPAVPAIADKVHTGDLGFLHQGELYIVDRLKNIVIIKGVNYPAADLEERVAAAVGMDVEAVMVFEEAIAGDRDAVVAVVETGAEAPAIGAEALQALSGLLTAIHCIKRRALPKTTSGKKQHHLCRALLASGRLPILRTIPLSAAPASA